MPAVGAQKLRIDIIWAPREAFVDGNLGRALASGAEPASRARETQAPPARHVATTGRLATRVGANGTSVLPSRRYDRSIMRLIDM